MFCTQCGYRMDAYDSVCPRCQGQGIPNPAPPALPPAPVPNQPAPSVASFLQALDPHAQVLASIEDFTAHQAVWSKDHKSGVAVDEGRALLCLLWLDRSFRWQWSVLAPKDILEVQIIEDEHVVVSENATSRTSGTGLGTVVLGVGVMTGGMGTRGKKKSEQFEEVTRIDLKILTDDLRRPFHVVNFMQHWKTNRRGFVYPKAREQADYCHSQVVALMRRG